MKFSKQILKWYKSERRELPWRATKDPYLIWLSEVILQQTRVEQGLAYYKRFAERFPVVEKLASADEDEVLKLWQGLGYYSRARNLLQAARHINNEYNGQIPDNYSALKSLKGIGDYTAAAIASIAFNEAVPVVDGNVKRVLARLYGLESTGNQLYRDVKEIMEDNIDPTQAGEFNQAVMEFGALQCTPKNPKCTACIFKNKCKAFANDMTDKLPVRQDKRKPQEVFLYYLVIRINAEEPAIIFKKRTARGIWLNLYDFPMVESDQKKFKNESVYQKFHTWFVDEVKIKMIGKGYHHQLTHRTLNVKFYTLTIDHVKSLNMQKDWLLVPLSRIKGLPVPRLIDRFISDNQSLFS
jgi:A/G-specific adenine glycosylase